jgi:S-adenosylmethionine:tRNA ribosyltransferase-isomerase
MFSIENYDYELPVELIAQHPVAQREESRLLCLHQDNGALSHHRFYEIYNLLSPSDILVVNNTEVIPARLLGKKSTGGKAEVLILDYAGRRKADPKNGEFGCQCLIKTSKRPKNGTKIFFDQGLEAEVIDYEHGAYSVRFTYQGGFERLLYRIGHVPLPPYIKRGPDHATWDDSSAYQTVYASQKGAVAAPTAGLHFTQKLLEKLEATGVRIVPVTLHVGYGTFLPVRVADIRDHKIHSEWYSISKSSADTLNTAKAKGRRIVAVGTTSVRALEHAWDNSGQVCHGIGNCNLFIYPGYRFKVVDAMITNFHLPKSTLLMLVSAFAGRERILHAYRTAIEKRYRFFSYGDAMFIV